MQILLILKLRKEIGSIVVSSEAINRIVDLSEETAKNQLYKLFSESDKRVHDIVWLEHIINWTPEGGYSITEMIPWINLAQRLTDVDATQEYEFTLLDNEVTMIYEKVTHTQFKYTSAQGPFISFLLNFFELLDKFPDDLQS